MTYAERYEAGLKKAKDSDAARLLRIVMRDISEDCYCAGWLSDLEITLWSAVLHGPRRFGMGEITEGDIAELKRLSEKAGGWWTWQGEAADSGEEFVTLDEWTVTDAGVKAAKP